MENFNDFDLQIILYSKDWYDITNTIDDIRHIMHVVSGTDVKYIKDIEVLYQVASTSHKVMSTKGITSYDLVEIFQSPWKKWPMSDPLHITMSDQIESLLRVIRYKSNEHYPELPEPSSKYLPIGEGRLSLWREYSKKIVDEKKSLDITSL